MKIAVSGTHGTGKTLKMFELAKDYKLKYPNKEVTVITEIARKCPLPINEDAPLKAQEWLICSQVQKEIEAEMKNDIVITDRCLADCAAYARNIDEYFFQSILPYLRYHIQSYDKIIYKSLAGNGGYLIDDGIRSTNEQFQKDIDRILSDIYSMLSSNIKKLVVV